jgi:tryptophan synthase alpha chain
MNRIETAFQKKPIFMPYFPLGYPDLETSIECDRSAGKNGADLIEVGLSFSDPLADGPVIQQATQVAWKRESRSRNRLKQLKELRKRGVTIPLYFDGIFQPHAGVWTGEICP